MGQILDKLYVLDRIGVCLGPRSNTTCPFRVKELPPSLSSLDTNKYNAVTGNIIGSLEELIAPLFRG